MIVRTDAVTAIVRFIYCCVTVIHCSPTDVTLEDSGNYTCEVRGPHSVVLRRVTHSLYVRSKHFYSSVLCDDYANDTMKRRKTS
jgi:hypothetical protein